MLRRRWIRRIVWGSLIAIALLVIAVQVTFWTDYPRRLVLSLVQRELGLRVEARTLSTGWFGRTTLTDVRLSLPLADESFLELPELRLQHTGLLPLLITQNFDLHGIDLEKPNLVIRRDANGRWNVQDVIELVGKATAGTPEPGTKKSPPKLPRLTLADGTIVIIEHDGRRATIKPVNVTGYPDGMLVYRYDGTIPGGATGDKPMVKLVGEVAPGDDWRHQFTLFAQPPKEWLAPWTANPPDPLVINARWSGSVQDKVLHARLEAQDVKYTVYGGRGLLTIETGGDQPTVLHPQSLVLTTDAKALPEVRLVGGTVRIDGGNKIALERLRITMMNGEVKLDGSADLAAKSATLAGEWQELIAPTAGGDVRHGGSVTVSLKCPFPDRPEIAATFTSRGRVPGHGSWDGQLRVEGSGRGWNDIDWLLTLPRVTWNGRTPFEVNDFAARLAQRQNTITLTELRWPAAQRLTGRGDVNLRDESWRLRISGAGMMNRLPPTPQQPFDFSFDARGNWNDAQHWFNARLDPLVVRSAGTEVRISGDYLSQKPEPLALNVALNHRPEGVADEVPISGRLRSQIDLHGTLDPLNLHAGGFVRSDSLVVRGRTYGDIRGTVDVAVGAEKSELIIRDMAILGGKAQVVGIWPYAGEDKLIDPSTEGFRVVLRLDGVQLRELGDLLAQPLEGGSGTGMFTIDVPIRRPTLETVAAKGAFDATNVAAGGENEAQSPFHADQVKGEVTLRDGLLRVDPVRFTRAERDVRGEATLSVELTTASPKTPTLKLSAQSWPLGLGAGGGVAALSADASLGIDARDKPPTLSGPLTARVRFATTQAAIGEAVVEGHLDGRLAVFEKIDLSGIGGNATGRATIDADNPNRSTAQLAWKDIDGARLGDLVPAVRGLAGTYAGNVTIGPSADVRAIEPLRVTVDLNPSAGKFRTIDIGPAKLSAFANLSRAFTFERVVIDMLPSEDLAALAAERELDKKKVPPQDRPLTWNDVRIAGGRVRLWARRGRHPSGLIQTHITADLFRLDIDQMVHALRSDADPMPAKLSGEIILHGNPRDLDQVFGQGQLKVTDSDLAKADVLAFLYDLVGLGTAPKEPNGRGSLQLSLQSSTLQFNNVHYFNRGVEAWSSALKIEDVWNMPHSKIEGYVVGSARPLSALKIPFLADVDQIMAVLQSNLTTVKVSGTVEQPQTKTATFSDVGDALKRFMGAQVQGEQ
jgi:hypothetical protein